MTRSRIIIETATPEEMRPPYNTAGEMMGDWYIASDGVLVIKVTGDVLAREGFLYALHELIEAFLCLDRGISQQSVDAFDARFNGDGEPGDSPLSPYRSEHRAAMLIEHLMAHEMGMDDYGEIA
jgi:hypothetical protein